MKRLIIYWLRGGCRKRDFEGDDCRFWVSVYLQHPCRNCAERWSLGA